MKEKIDNCSWFSRHKNFVIIGSTVIAVSAAVAAYLLLKPGNATVKFSEMNKPTHTPDFLLADVSAVENKTVDTHDSILQKGIDVESYLRNLPEGQKASPAKIAEAANLGIVLPKGKTLVDSYSYNRYAA